MPANEFTAILDILPGKKPQMEALLKQIGNPLKVDNKYLQFPPKKKGEKTTETHFARMVILPGKDEPIVYPDAPLSSRLLFSAIFDGDEKLFIQELDKFSPQLRDIWGLCDGYASSGGDLYKYLSRYRHRPQLFYSTFLNETVESITQKTAFRNEVQKKLDNFLPNLDAALDAIYGVARFKNAFPANIGLQSLLELILGIGVLLLLVVGSLIWIIGQNQILGGLLLIALVIVVLLIAIPILKAFFGQPQIGTLGAVQDQIESLQDEDIYPLSMLTGREDVIVQNQFNLYLTFKGNTFERTIHLWRMSLLMFILHRTLRIKPASGSLAGLTTVHFGHWVLIDGGRRLFFMTNYDGSWENYIADFVNKIYPLLDMQLWAFVGFDDEGTRNIAAFRRWLRRVQLQSDVFYSAYPHSTVRNIARDLEITHTFPENRADRDAVHNWLKLLADPHIRTEREKPGTDLYQNRPPLEPDLSKTSWSDIQSIIVYGYANLPHGRYLFLHIDDPAKAKNWLKAIIPLLTTVDKWEDDDPARTLQTALNIAFTYPGLTKLHLHNETLSTFSREFREGMAPLPKGTDKLHPRSINLGDTDESAPKNWTVGNRPGQPEQDEIHIMLLVNGTTAAVVDALLATEPFSHIVDTTAGLSIVRVEQGMAPVTGREPFGFRDGISNPWVEGTRYSVREADGSKGKPLRLSDTRITKHEPNGLTRDLGLEHDPVVRTGEFILGYMNEYGQLPATPMILTQHDPNKQFSIIQDDFRDFGRNGSYLVYRKLVQDVQGFWGYLSHGSANSHETLKRAAKLVGRWPSGTPLVLSPEQDDKSLVQKVNEERNNSLNNNFRFRMEDMDDSDAMRCPFGSHTRRSHPRDGLLDDKPWEAYRHSNLHRIMRRSAAFGRLPDHAVQSDYFERVGAPVDVTYTDHPDHLPDDDGVGIHFLGINANIQQQFEFIQQTWNNNSRFNGMFNSKDPITGIHAVPQSLAARLGDANKYAERAVDSVQLQTSSMTIPGKLVHEHLTDLPRFVTVRGGAYLFLPSKTALRYIAEA